MSFNITTTACCDECENLDSKSGGASGKLIHRTEAWKRAESVGWRKLFGKTLCARCALFQNEDALDRLHAWIEKEGKPEIGKVYRKRIDNLSREINVIRRQSGILF